MSSRRWDPCIVTYCFVVGVPRRIIMAPLERDAAVVDLSRQSDVPWKRSGRDAKVAVSKQQHDPSSDKDAV
jgi:hypothetical protein